MGHNTGTTFNIDRLEVVALGIPNIASRIHARFSPNTMHQLATLRFDNPSHAAYRFVLNDAIGRTVAVQRDITGEEVRIDGLGCHQASTAGSFGMSTVVAELWGKL